VVSPATAEAEALKGELPLKSDGGFDPLTFVQENLKGYSSRLGALSLDDLRRLAADTGLKCLALNQVVFDRQEQETSGRLEREVSAAKEELEKDLANQLAESQADFTKRLEKEKKKISSSRKNRRNLTTAPNSMIVALVKIWKDAGLRDAEMSQLQSAADRLDGDLKELEGEYDALKEQAACQYVEGFEAALAQVRVLFPGLDGEVLAQADFLKKVEDGKLVSRLPA
jgi:chromosome segregation ATPase